MKIAFIGSGKMAEALISRLPSRQVIISDIDRARLKLLSKKYSVKIAAGNKEAYDEAEVVVLAVKPQQIAGVIADLKGLGKKLVVSIAAGIPLSSLQKNIPGSPVVRVMPNNPCLVVAGISALVKGNGVTPGQFKQVEKIFKLVGETVVVPEKWFDAITGLSGSGPAYIYAVIEALIEGGRKNGLPRELAKKLTLQTVYGAAKTAIISGVEPGKLREMVTSPGGTTMEGLAVLKDRKVPEAFAAAVLAAARKS
ncbi:MAG: pyrroline-5-carboxylate reductase, partial [Candidatus Margulisbacteria bacterium]|nr:pyrroline-5-carboxylate reductase [Candidatus Margulisiibacteriota bacterium]